MTISEKEASAETVLDKDSGLWYRPDLGELFVIKEQTQYKALEFEDKTVMDVGAHIGCFTSLAIKQGAKHVWAYEPTKESFDILSRNLLSRHMWSTLYNTALIGGSEDSVDFYLSKKYPTCHTHMPVRGREKVTVDAMNFWERVDLHKPDVLKIDVEGGEYDFIFQKEIPDFVEQIAIELHLGKKGYRELGIKTAKLFGDWHYHTSFRFSWHITTLILHRNKQGKGTVKERIEELEL
tara:strand:+ start:180 stop:890 length:711 start_codon:yes stop_codon:yes gene_type:complete